MTLTIIIQMDNDAFNPDQGIETARILKEYAERIEYENIHNFERALKDINDNRVGEAKVTR